MTLGLCGQFSLGAAGFAVLWVAARTIRSDAIRFIIMSIAFFAAIANAVFAYLACSIT
jgi:hypothetical protein